MRQAHRNRPGNRAAFTLVELLVVIAIIVILVSLTAAGVLRLLSSGTDTQVKAEIGQLEAALRAAKTFFKDVPYLPSRLVLREDNKYNLTVAEEAATVSILQRLWPRINLSVATVSGGTGPGIDWNGDGVISTTPWYLEGQHCLVFWLGGIPQPATPTVGTGCRGFGLDPTNPGLNGNPALGTKQPFFDFKSSRLIKPNAGGFYAYADAYNTSMPYAYFAALPGGVYNRNSFPPGPLPPPVGVGDCPSLGVAPYESALNTFINANSYQIISAGKDGKFGYVDPNAKPNPIYWNPSTGWPAGTVGTDDYANFSQAVLGSAQN
jgi:prepilin-type N-terminal cleavage/methylation domain-containing protein